MESIISGDFIAWKKNFKYSAISRGYIYFMFKSNLTIILKQFKKILFYQS